MNTTRICVNDPSNSKLDSHYNIWLPKSISQALRRHGLRDVGDVPHSFIKALTTLESLILRLLHSVIVLSFLKH